MCQPPLPKPYIHASVKDNAIPTAQARRRIQIHKLHISAARNAQDMPLNAIIASMKEPVKPEVVKEIIRYMKGVPSEHETLVLQCAELLHEDQSLQTVLAIAHALNEGEFLLKCRDDDLLSEHDLSSEFDKLMNEDKKDSH